MANAYWKQTGFRIKDPKVTLPFYQEHFGMQLVGAEEDKDTKVTTYYLACTKNDEPVPKSDTIEAQQFILNSEYTLLALQHEAGAENKADLKYNNGNVEPNRGFGHIAFNTHDVYEVCKELEEKGVQFKKKPDEGRMKGLAFALDPDGYWIEIISRKGKFDEKNKYNLSQTMIRVKDQKRTLAFYEALGMKNIAEKHFEEAKFSLFFLTSARDAQKPEDDGFDYMKSLFHPVLELTHNHGTESQEDFSYHNGNTDPVGFSHIAFSVDDVDGTVKTCLEKGGKLVSSAEKKAVVQDPDGYHVHLIKRA